MVVITCSSSSSSRDFGNSNQNAAAPAAKVTTAIHTSTSNGRKRRRTWFLATFFFAANLLSAITWSVLHQSSYSQSDDKNWPSSSSLISDIINELLLAAAPPEISSSSSSWWSSTFNTTTTINNDNNNALTPLLYPTRHTILHEPGYPLLQPFNATKRQKQNRTIFPRVKGGDTCRHRNIVKENKKYHVSTIEYISCCGLGHRLTRMSAAAMIATKLQAHLYTYWRCCNNVEVFSYLFGNDPIILYNQQDDITTSTETNGIRSILNLTTPRQQQQQQKASSSIHLQFRNDVPGFKEASGKCSCTKDKVISDFAFYSTLRERYMKKHIVDDFVHEHFTNQTLSIAIHIRAGNGEKGDFTNKKRQINDTATFVRNTANMIREIVAQNIAAIMSPSSPAQQQQLLSPLVFIATDTPSYVDAFRRELATPDTSSSSNYTSPIPVVTLPAQVHAAQGQGVMFGVFSKVTQSGEQCEAGWDGVLQDMLVMSHADVVFAPAYSSFTQTLPLSLTLGRSSSSSSKIESADAHGGGGGDISNKRHYHDHIQAPFCDVQNSKLQCYESVQHWCCSGARLKTRTHHDVARSWRNIMLQE
jgi:hypothetical protein